jgi:SAM-dependent methyltransferase
MAITFEDHFSALAADYRDYRPNYPDSLFKFLAGFAPARKLAWDCATGSGQAARGLARHFEHVIATDASDRQIAHADSGSNIEYRVAAAEDSGLESNSVDLATAAQAMHWFKLPAFYREVQRVLRPGGVLAVWSYGLFHVTPAIDGVVQHFYAAVLHDYWPEQRQLVEDGYCSLPFPFDEISVPFFQMSAIWDLEQVLGYLGTWSAVQRYREDRAEDPIPALAAQLQEAWGNSADTRTVRWPLSIRAGRLE